MSTQAQSLTPVSGTPRRVRLNEFRSGGNHGPRRLNRLIARVPQPVAEMLLALFDVQDDDEPHPVPTGQPNQHNSVTHQRELHAGEVIEKYVIDSARVIFGLSYFEYANRRAKGEQINLRALFEMRHAQILAGVQ
jgi:hypothetical protein